MREYLLVGLIAAIVTYLLGGLFRRFAFRFNIVAIPRTRDVHVQPTPYLGGVAMFCGLIAAFLVAIQLPWLGSFDLVYHDTLGVLLGGGLLCLVGAIDDKYELSAIAKIAGQILAAGVAVVFGVRIYWIPIPQAIVSIDQGTSIAITLVMIFISVNAINLIDGLDGLAAGVVAIGAGAFFVYAYLLSYEQELIRATASSLIAIGIVGICLGFLPYNVHKARMFMGDSGSMLLGFLMANCVILLTGQIDPALLDQPGANAFAAYLPLALPLAVMMLPILDLVMAYTRRAVKGQAWWKPDKQHLHHRMLRLGHGHLKAVSLLWLWSAVISFGVVLIGLFPYWYTIAALGLALLIAIYLTWGVRLRDRRRARRAAQ